MSLPLSPPIAPQLALTRKALPRGEGWAYEPKLDGFRAIVFVDGDDVYIQSRAGLERVNPGTKKLEPVDTGDGGVPATKGVVYHVGSLFFTIG